MKKKDVKKLSEKIKSAAVKRFFNEDKKFKIRYKIKNRKRRYLCDVDNCDNYAYAEMIRVHKGWMHVCHKHYKLKLNKKGIPKEKDVGFYILKRKRSG